MLNAKYLVGLVFIIPLLSAAIPAEAATKDATAARAACFKQANAAAAAASSPSDPAAQNERQAAGYAAYVACCRKAGIAP
jgi:hypothetical protein